VLRYSLPQSADKIPQSPSKWQQSGSRIQWGDEWNQRSTEYSPLVVIDSAKICLVKNNSTMNAPLTGRRMSDHEARVASDPRRHGKGMVADFFSTSSEGEGGELSITTPTGIITFRKEAGQIFVST